MKEIAAAPAVKVRRKSLGRRILEHWQIYLLLLPAVVYFIIFYYWPMAGLQIAFRDYRVSKGIWGSTWVGLKYFRKFFNHPQCLKIISNTLVLSLYTLATFPLSILLALMINELRNRKFKKTVQMVTYAPHFISTVGYRNTIFYTVFGTAFKRLKSFLLSCPLCAFILFYSGTLFLA